MIYSRKLYFRTKTAFICFSICALFITGHSAYGEDFAVSFFSIPCTGKTDGFYEKNKSMLSISSDDADFTLPETSSQKKIKRISSTGSTTVRIATGINQTYYAKPGSADTATTRYVNLSDPNLTALSKTIKGSTGREIIAGVRATVFEYIIIKKSGMPIVSSEQILLKKAGDCKQHTVLAVSLLRKKGIPARAVSGLIYQKEFNGGKNRFVFHMWTEAFDGTSWIICDASFPPEAAKASHYIALSYHSLKSESPMEFTTAMYTIKNLRINAE
jgi:transglutaminase-like putative cysteine protease